MKSVLLVLMTLLGVSNSWGSGCDSLQVYESQGSLQSVQVESDLLELSRAEVLKLLQDFKENYGYSVGSNFPELPLDGYFRTKIQLATYKNLDTDCGWDLYKWTIAMKQLVIQISEDKFLVYPTLSHLRGEEIKNEPYLRITR